MAFCICIFVLQLRSLRFQQVQQAGSSIPETNGREIGCTFTILRSELKLSVTIP
jgi:hypothetical protein